MSDFKPDYGITGFGAYVPRQRLERTAIAAAHRWMAPSLKGLAKGSRAFASWDEDAITLAVEAVRDCLGVQGREGVTDLALASTTLPFADLQNSVIVASALGLSPSVRAVDAGGSQRAGVSALVGGLRACAPDAVVVAADRPRAKPASVQEMVYGAGAAAFRLGADAVIARPLGAATVSAPFVDHFRPAGAAHDYVWEERWIRDEGYAKLIPPGVDAALAQARVGIGDISTLVLASPLKGAAAAVAKRIGFAGVLADAHDDGCGYAGAAHPLLMLASALEAAEPGQKILLIGFGQGVDALVLETTEALAAYRPRRGVRGSIAEGVQTNDYLRMASFYGEIDLEWGMRAEKTGKAALTHQYREAHQLYAFVGGRSKATGKVEFPRLAYSVNPEHPVPVSELEDHPLADEPAKVLTFTDDWLSYHPAPPLRVGFVQFDVGARLLMEIVDVGPQGVDIGTPLQMVFRIKEPDKARGYNRYFWKATPVASDTIGEQN